MKYMAQCLKCVSLVPLLALVMLLQGCPLFDDETVSGSSSTLSGTAAVGRALRGRVAVMDSAGNQADAPIEEGTGNFVVNVSGLAGPFSIEVIDQDSGKVFYSWAENANTNVNVTPLTTLAMLLAANQASLTTLHNDWANSNGQLTAGAIRDAQQRINANFAALFNAAGLTATSFDFFSEAFATNGQGFDAILDALDLDFDFSGAVMGDRFTVTVNSNAFNFGTGAFKFNINIDTTGFDGIGGGNSGGNTGGGSSGGSLPFGSSVVRFVYDEISTGAPYADAQEATFTFSSSGALFIDQDNTPPDEIQINSFTEQNNEFIWIDTVNGFRYALSLLNNAINEINVFSEDGNTFFGQFTVVSSSGGGGGGSSMGAIEGTWTLTVSGTVNGTPISNVVTANLPANQVFANETAFVADVESIAQGFATSVVTPGANLSVNISGVTVSYTPNVSGVVGDTITGRYTATVQVSGSVAIPGGGTTTIPPTNTSVDITYTFTRTS